ncbi:MAG TPA: carbon-nitrogen family hydrolase [Negativicutes bacterium]|nr:carbon-nitrogen family hydrolase [Negativicutes bacterium]
MKIALLQMDIVLGDATANRRKAADMIATGLSRGAELLVLPEMWTTGYKLAEIDRLAEPDDGPTMTMLRANARENGVEIVTGSMAEARDGKVYNTCYAIDASGEVVAKYSKIHLIGLMQEDRYIEPGDSKAMFSLRCGPAGMIICYDLRFTELPRTLALAGCRTLFVPAEWPAQRGAHWRTLNLARAIENQMFVIAVNRVGRDPDNVYFGHSLVVNPWGEVLAEGSEDREEVIVADVDFAAGEEIRRRMPVFADRRPQYY